MKKIRKFIIPGLIMFSLVICLCLVYKNDSFAVDNPDAVYKSEKLSELKTVEEKLNEYEQSNNITRESWSEEGKLLQKKAELEKETDSEKYYKDQLDMFLNATDVAVSDMQIQLEASERYNLSYEKKNELEERVEKFGNLIESVKKAMKDNDSYENLFKKSQAESDRLSEYFSNKYSDSNEK